jgi:hypothetical protein
LDCSLSVRAETNAPIDGLHLIPVTLTLKLKTNSIDREKELAARQLVNVLETLIFQAVRDAYTKVASEVPSSLDENWGSI